MRGYRIASNNQQPTANSQQPTANSHTHKVCNWYSTAPNSSCQSFLFANCRPCQSSVLTGAYRIAEKVGSHGLYVPQFLLVGTVARAAFPSVASLLPPLRVMRPLRCCGWQCCWLIYLDRFLLFMYADWIISGGSQSLAAGQRPSWLRATTCAQSVQPALRVLVCSADSA